MSASTFERRPGPERNKYKELVEHLKQHPGEWVKVRTAPNPDAAGAAAYQIKKGRRADFRPAGEFDAYTTGCDVIARYIGPATEGRGVA